MIILSASSRKNKLSESSKIELIEYKATLIENLDMELERINKLKIELGQVTKELDKLLSAKKNKKRSLRRINSELMRRGDE